MPQVSRHRALFGLGHCIKVRELEWQEKLAARAWLWGHTSWSRNRQSIHDPPLGSLQAHVLLAILLSCPTWVSVALDCSAMGTPMMDAGGECSGTSPIPQRALGILCHMQGTRSPAGAEPLPLWKAGLVPVSQAAAALCQQAALARCSHLSLVGTSGFLPPTCGGPWHLHHQQSPSAAPGV